MFPVKRGQRASWQLGMERYESIHEVQDEKYERPKKHYFTNERHGLSFFHP